MLAELGGVSKIIIAVGYTDLRLGINGLAQVVGPSMISILSRKEHCSCSTEEKLTGSKPCSGKEMDSFSYISAWRMDGLTGQEPLPRLQA